jgi:hypothetical protein
MLCAGGRMDGLSGTLTVPFSGIIRNVNLFSGAAPTQALCDNTFS